MAIELPAPIAGYFAADQGSDAAPLASCFTEDAIVKDEGRTYSGRDAVRRWKVESSTRYTYTVDPFAIADEAGRSVVTAHLTGDFPGSPVDLRYCFTLQGDLIAALEIVP